MTEPQKLANYVQPALSEARIQAQWGRIGAHQHQPVWSQRWLYAGIGGVAAAALVVVVAMGALRGRAQPDARFEGLLVERDATGQQTVNFPEGLTVLLPQQARYRLLERTSKVVHLQLERGSAEFDVVPGKDRQVIVTAAGFDVEVMGTHFAVSLIGENAVPDVAVSVQRGVVRVRPTGLGGSHEVIRTLAAGESWATQTGSNAVPPAPAADATASSGLGSSGAVLPSAAPTPSVTLPVAPTTAKDLFEQAESHRLKGRLREAAAAFDRLRRNFPNDPRAGLAAFELGRLRMDQLGDSAGALNAFSDSLRLEPSARFREDVQARLVQLYDSLGQREQCLKARAEYQSRYPSGSYTKSIGNRCMR